MRRAPGFTLADMTITVGLLALLSATAIPALSYMLLDARMTEQVNGLVHAVHLAKQSAHTRLAEVVLCASPDGLNCAHDGRWQDGWLLFVNEDADYPPQPDAGEAALAAGGGFEGGGIRANRRFFVFRASTTRSTNGTFTFCDRRGPEEARAVIVSYTGRPRAARRDPGGGALICQM